MAPLKFGDGLFREEGNTDQPLIVQKGKIWNRNRIGRNGRNRFADSVHANNQAET